MIKIAHNMALKNISYLFLPVCLVSGFRFQVSGVKKELADTGYKSGPFFAKIAMAI